MTVQKATYDRSVEFNGAVVAVSWASMANGDSGEPVKLAQYGDKTFQVLQSSTFGAAGNVLIEGSNDGINFTSLSNRQGTAMNFTAAGMNTSQDRPIYVRPRVTTGDGTTAILCVLAAHRSDISIPG